MISPHSASLPHLSAHHIGNKTNGEDLLASKTELTIHDDDLRANLLTYFLSSFTSDEYFNFTSTNDDFNLNPLFQLASDLFKSDKQFHVKSVSMAKHLYEVSIHPQIKSGDLFVAMFKNAETDGQRVEAIGIFKAESKSSFLKLTTKKDGNFELDCESGISLEKLDKACLIYNIDAENGYRVSIIDKTSKSTEAQYWKELFLKVKPVNNGYHSTKALLEIARHYVTDQLSDEFELSKADQLKYLDKSIGYFKNHEEFNQREFEKEVFADPEVIKSYKKFDAGFRDQFNINVEPTFDISPEVVKRQSRVFKSVLKLDKNFHIYIHGDRELIERGTEKDGRKFYKIYYREEF